MGILESVKKGFSVAASSLPVALVLFIFGFIFSLINIALLPQTQASNASPSPAMIAAGLVFVLVTVFMQAGSMGYVREKIKQGNVTFSSFLSMGSKYYVKILCLSLVIALIIGAFVLVAALVVAVLGQKMQYLAMGIAIVIAAIGIYVLILLFFAPYIAINEEKGVTASLKESVRVVRANILKVVLLALLLIAIGFLVGVLIGFAVGLISRSMPGDSSKILFAFFSSLVNAFLGLFVTSSFMGFYLGSSSPSPSGTAQQP